MTSQIDIDCRHYYGDRELGTARPVDINDHQESTERHRQRAVRQTTETPQRPNTTVVSQQDMKCNKQKTYILMSSLRYIHPSSTKSRNILIHLSVVCPQMRLEFLYTLCKSIAVSLTLYFEYTPLLCLL